MIYFADMQYSGIERTTNSPGPVLDGRLRADWVIRSGWPEHVLNARSGHSIDAGGDSPPLTVANATPSGALTGPREVQDEPNPG